MIELIFGYIIEIMYLCIRKKGVIQDAMNKILKVRNVGDYSRWVGHTDRHPLVSVIDYAEVSPIRHSLNNYSIYGIFFHDEAEIDLAYGCG